MIIHRPDMGWPKDRPVLSLWDPGMSNEEHEIDDGCEDLIRAGSVAKYHARDFMGLVWLDGEGFFSCQIWRYGHPVATVIAASLEDLMREASDEWGWA